MLDIVLTTGSVTVLTGLVLLLLYYSGEGSELRGLRTHKFRPITRMALGVRNIIGVLLLMGLAAGAIFLPVASLAYLAGSFG